MAKFARKFRIRLTRGLNHRNFHEKLPHFLLLYKATYTCARINTRANISHASLGERCVCVVAAVGACSRARLSLSCACTCVRTCVRACKRAYKSVCISKSEQRRERGEERGNNSTAFSGNDLSPSLRPPPPMPCSKPTSDTPPRRPFLSSVLARTLDVPTLFYVPFSFLSSTCRSGNPHSHRERRSDTERIDCFIASRKVDKSYLR